MRLAQLPGAPELTYCTNIHAGESWDEIRASLDAHVPRIKAQVAPDAPFGLGLRLSGVAAAELVGPEPLEAFKDQLARLGAYVFTLNAFPFGPFHGTRVKERVYEPDWRTGERVELHARRRRHPGGASAGRRLRQHLDGAGRLQAGRTRAEGGRRPRRPSPSGCRAPRRDRAQGGQAHRARARARALLLPGDRRGDARLLRGRASQAGGARALRRACRARRRRGRADAAPPSRRLLRRLPRRRRIRGAGRGARAACAAPASRSRRSSSRRRCACRRSRPRSRRGSATSTPASTCTRWSCATGGSRASSIFPTPSRPGEGGAQGEWRIHCHVPVFLADLGELGSTQDALLATLRR